MLKNNLYKTIVKLPPITKGDYIDHSIMHSELQVSSFLRQDLMARVCFSYEDVQFSYICVANYSYLS